MLLLTIGCACAAERNVTVGRVDAAPHAKRVALVIGNGKYPGAPLRNPVNDARDVAAALKKLGFEVIERFDVPQKEMNRAITQFGARLSGDTAALFYYAGHGIQVRGKNYLVPVDAQIASEASVRSETVDVDALLEQLGTSPLNIVILDACRNNPFERRFRGTGGGLAQMDAPKGTLIAYATAPGKVALDGEGRNGLYTQELLKQMQTPGLSVESMFKRVRAGVARATGDNQMPWEASSLTGEFFFNPAADRIETAVAAPASTIRVQSAEEIEQDFWDRIKGLPGTTGYGEYLKRYPAGRFEAIAKLEIAKLGQGAANRHPHDGVWTGDVETIGDLFGKDKTTHVQIRVEQSRLVGSAIITNDNRVFSGTVDREGNLVDARLTGKAQIYHLAGKLWDASGDGSGGWKLRMRLQPQGAVIAGQGTKSGPPESMIKGALVRTQGDGKRWLIVVQEPNCKYCKKQEEELAKMQDLTIYTHIKTFSDDARHKRKAILCALDPVRAWAGWMLSGIEPVGRPDCDGQEEAQPEDLRRWLDSLTATPTILLPDGQVVTGYLAHPALESRLGQAWSSSNAGR
jgi:uncharacterized caspase-like protein